VALEGFVALAPDFLSPLGGTPGDEDKARDLFAKLEPAKTAANAVATVAFLKEEKDGNGKVGAVGFCWGGGTVNTLAVNAPDLKAGVAYYGMQPKAEDVPKIKAALLLHYAGLDRRVSMPNRRLQEGTRRGPCRIRRSMFMNGSTAMPSTTTHRRRATTNRRRISPGGGRSPF
jgi:dienelactone hydrolase